MAEFDSFISYNGKEKSIAIELAEALRARELKIWIDEWEMIPGRPWLDQVEKIILSTRSALILTGPSGIGPWEEPEMRACIGEFVKRRIPVIPVLLPGAEVQPVLPMFLSQFSWVDLRRGFDEKGLDALEWGITGVKPERGVVPTPISAPTISTTSVSTSTALTHASKVYPPFDSSILPTVIWPQPETSGGVRFSVVFTGTITESERSLVNGLLGQLRNIAQDSRLTLLSIEPGSTRFRLESRLEGFERIYRQFRSGHLKEILGQQVQSVNRHKLVVLIHGIRTRAEWQSKVGAILMERADVDVVSLSYGYFDLLRFLLPIFGVREQAITTIKRHLREALSFRMGGDPEVIVIAHSFGTYVISRILREEPDIRVDRLLLCGSIVPSTFKWEALPNCPPHVLNEVGTRDIWPALAAAATWGYGATGTFGFGAPRVRDRFHNIRHSDFFAAEFVRKYWKPWVQDDVVVGEEERRKISWLISLTERLPIRWIITAGGAAAFAQVWRSPAVTELTSKLLLLLGMKI